MRDGPRGFRQDYSCPALLRIPLGLVCVHVRNCHPLRCSFPDASIPHTSAMARSYNPCDALLQRRFGLLPGRSPLLGESFLFSFPAGTKMFQFPALASSQTYAMMTGKACRVVPFGYPRVKVICTSPRLFAAYRVLHRLREPRHPPCALSLFSHNSVNTVLKKKHQPRRDRPGREDIRNGVTLILILCLFCRSMSKNSIPRKRGGWRISGSNR